MRLIVLDIGGTSIKYGIYENGILKNFSECETEAGKGGAHVMRRTIEIIESLGACDGIGVSTAGQVDINKGCIQYANENIPNYTGTAVKEILEKKFGVPAVVENDVNAAALGEGKYGTARGISDYLCLTYGTGIGGAIVIDGKIVRGAAGSAGEFGSMIVHKKEEKSENFSDGYYESYASTSALVRKVRTIMPEITDGRQVFEKFENPAVRKAIDEWIQEVVDGLITLIHIFNPECMILGGGVMSQKYVIETVEAVVRQKVMPKFRDVKIIPAGLENKGGLYGAAYLAETLLWSSSSEY